MSALTEELGCRLAATRSLVNYVTSQWPRTVGGSSWSMCLHRRLAVAAEVGWNVLLLTRCAL